jgi:hypothetical protein
MFQNKQTDHNLTTLKSPGLPDWFFKAEFQESGFLIWLASQNSFGFFLAFLHDL